MALATGKLLMTQNIRPTTDAGTVFFHFLFVCSFVVLAMTGIRIASDDPIAPWLRIFDFFLPVEQLWFRHLVAAVFLTGALLGYATYIYISRLIGRIRLDRPRIIGLSKRGPARAAGFHALIIWAMIASLLFEIVTGFALFLGFGEPFLVLHFWSNWVCILVVFWHVALQGTKGGLAQLTRIFRPVALVIPPPNPDLAELLAEQLEASRQGTQTITTQSGDIYSGTTTLYAHPAITAFGVLVAFCAVGAGLEQLSRPVLLIKAISANEALGGSLDAQLDIFLAR